MSRSRLSLLVLAVVVAAVFAWPALPSGSETLSGARETRAQVEELRERIVRADLAAASATFPDDLAAARRAVPDSPDLVGVIAAIDDAVARSNMFWVSGSPSAAAGDDGSWRVSLTLTGSAYDVSTLLDNLRALPRLIVVDSLQVRGVSPAAVSLNVRFFARPAAPAAPPGPGE